ncbi:Galactose oxidase precursor, putative [Ricinus communis]|uniref:Galactose oxidase, putative n=1 Tax=Ricinus communis TaxID=3988 RepID=B9REU4_RICCO|nr:Galactose oxidase precursor, putative [Ricinus communis]
MASDLLKLLLSLVHFTFYFPATSQTLPSYPGRQGEWNQLQSNIGITAMHMQLLHDNKVIIYDRTDFGRSNVSLPHRRCRHDSRDQALEVDCTAHTILYDLDTNSFRPLTIQTDVWCSSASVIPNGTLIQTGGYNDGDHVMRSFTSCLNDDCDWIEFRDYLRERRWYASNQILPDGRIIIVGGRRAYTYEFYPSVSRTFWLSFLRETRDGNSENNLYPFLHLLPDGNLFIFANTRSILLDYNRNHVIREFPRIPNHDPRNYPSTGSSVLLPLDENSDSIRAEILICGGAPRGSFERNARRVFEGAISSCGRLVVTRHNPSWDMETMPTPRVMSDMLLLPTGDIIIINGAQSGTAGYDAARNPITNPFIYRPHQSSNRRFSVMTPSQKPRMYHSSAILLPDGRVLVGGNLSLETFSPPYLSDEYTQIRPSVLSLDKSTLGYGNASAFRVRFHVEEYISDNVLSVRIVAPSFTTHSFAMNQRMVVLKMNSIEAETSNTYALHVAGPSTVQIAPPGYYLLFVVHAGTPSNGSWVKIQ